MKRMLSIFLAALLLLSVVPVGASATDSTYSEKELSVIVEKNNESSRVRVPVFVKDNELYVLPESLQEITRFSYAQTDVGFVFKLGSKLILVSPSEQTLAVNLIPQAFSGTLCVDGVHYLPLSEMLPWMNVEYSLSGNSLRLSSDNRSFWEVVEDFNSADYLYSVSEAHGDSAGSKVGICAMVLFDGILHMGDQWKRIVPISSDGSSLYDYELYRKCFRDIAFPEENAAEDMIGLCSEIKNLSGAALDVFDTIDEALHEERNLKWLSNLLGFTDSEVFQESDLGALKGISSAAGTFLTGLKYVSLSVSNTDDYTNALRHIYLSDQTQHPAALTSAVEQIVNVLDSEKDTLTDAGLECIREFALGILDKKGGDVLEDVLEKSCKSSLTAYTDIIDAALTLVWPVNEAYEEVVSMTTYQQIQWDALNSYYDISGDKANLDEEALSAARGAAVIFLKIARKCYEADQETFDLFGGEGILDQKILSISKKIVAFQDCAAVQERDAIRDRSAETIELKNMLVQVPLLNPGELIYNPALDLLGRPVKDAIALWGEDYEEGYTARYRGVDELVFPENTVYFNGTHRWYSFDYTEGRYYIDPAATEQTINYLLFDEQGTHIIGEYEVGMTLSQLQKNVDSVGSGIYSRAGWDETRGYFPYSSWAIKADGYVLYYLWSNGEYKGAADQVVVWKDENGYAQKTPSGYEKASDLVIDLVAQDYPEYAGGATTIPRILLPGDDVAALNRAIEEKFLHYVGAEHYWTDYNAWISQGILTIAIETSVDGGGRQPSYIYSIDLETNRVLRGEDIAESYGVSKDLQARLARGMILLETRNSGFITYEGLSDEYVNAAEFAVGEDGGLILCCTIHGTAGAGDGGYFVAISDEIIRKYLSGDTEMFELTEDEAAQYLESLNYDTEYEVEVYPADAPYCFILEYCHWEDEDDCGGVFVKVDPLTFELSVAECW